MSPVEWDAWWKLQRLHFSQALRRAREERRLTRKQLAESVGVTTKTILAWERGAYGPTVDHMASLATALKTKMDYLMLSDGGGPWDLTPRN